MDTIDFLSPFARLLADRCPPSVVRAIDAGGATQPLWGALEASGYLDALMPEATGGAGLSMTEAYPLLQALGGFAVPMPVAETMAARALFDQAGVEPPTGPIVLAIEGNSAPAGFAKNARWALVDDGTTLRLAALQDPDAPGVHQSGAALVPVGTAGATPPRPERGLLPLMATLRACAIAGASSKLLSLTVAYANDRVQFGRPVGRQQAVQQQLAVMAEKSIACRLAAQIGCASGLHPSGFAAATAKQVTSAAAAVVANIAHAVHGAIAISEDCDVQLYSRRLHSWRLADGSETYWARELGTARLAQPGVSSLDFVRQG